MKTCSVTINLLKPGGDSRWPGYSMLEVTGDRPETDGNPVLMHGGDNMTTTTWVAVQRSGG